MLVIVIRSVGPWTRYIPRRFAGIIIGIALRNSTLMLIMARLIDDAEYDLCESPGNVPSPPFHPDDYVNY
ncbi:unnamed protein product [Protopolystoma xenopodis]|uniref:Uncharacterized protein n=1 Tax=Protopolystoma xenopodis TaxID=117903 RepID=A0A3S5A5V5_9PLAT|nr:unnamed protein product [Protopolystoma xenopodis]